ncbi:hypothetical protein [Roseibium aggregatum]|uniref:Uncharacterized protein n=1 Tax=Roseibium aggregatum TaxID=187304 RepID=A0A939EIG6_9HYPH|nr:hypothetical protein [Roseibium aggregatum]MBN9673745.1 hypothetical protein [Roseibium aggregatum]
MSTRRTKWIFLVLPAVLLAGCADYMSHRDTVSFGAGDAMQTNIAIHTVNPFPPQAYETDLDRDGASVANAQERYLIPGDPEVPGSENRAAELP